MSVAKAQFAHRLSTFGPLYVLAYCGLAAAKAVTVGHMLQSIDPFLLVLTCFSIAALYFGWTERAIFSSGQLHPLRRSIVLLNISSTMSWIFFYLSLTQLQPAVVGAFTMGVGPVLTGFLLRLFRPGTRITLIEKISAIGVFVSMVYLALISLWGQTAIDLPAEAITKGLIYSFLCGLGVAGNTVFSKRLADGGLNAKQIMAVRFFLLLILAAAVCLGIQPSLTPLISNAPLVVAITSLGVILPLYLLQKGIVMSEPMVVALVLPLGPVMTLVLERFDPRLHFSLPSMLGVILVTGFCLLGAFKGKS